jgi:hypothetical protein
MKKVDQIIIVYCHTCKTSFNIKNYEVCARQHACGLTRMYTSMQFISPNLDHRFIANFRAYVETSS